MTLLRAAPAKAEPSTLTFQVWEPLLALPLMLVMVPVPDEGVTLVTQPAGVAPLVAAARTSPRVVVVPVGVKETEQTLRLPAPSSTVSASRVAVPAVKVDWATHCGPPA